MPPRGRPWMSAVPLALLLGLAVPALAKGQVDDALAAEAREALRVAGIRGVTVTSEWAQLQLTGPISIRDEALDVVAAMPHRDVVHRFGYTVVAAAGPTRPGAAIDPDGDTRRAAASSSWVKEG